MFGFTETVPVANISKGDTIILRPGRFVRVTAVTMHGDDTITLRFRGGSLRRAWDALVDIACTVGASN